MCIRDRESGDDLTKDLERKDFDRRSQLDLKAAESMLKNEGAPAPSI